jgi:hypothetical protein
VYCNSRLIQEASIATLVASAGTLVLGNFNTVSIYSFSLTYRFPGLSWLIGASLGEVLTSIIFLFIKHPFDVGDRVNLNGLAYTVKEINLLSTVFLDSKMTYVQAPNVVLNTLFIENIRRSPQVYPAFSSMVMPLIASAPTDVRKFHI